MKLKITILILTLAFSFCLKAQDKYLITWDYEDQSFKEFVSSAEILLKVKFYFKEEWVSDLKLGRYGDSNTLSDILGNLLDETALFYFIDDNGNIVFTKDYAVKVAEKSVAEEDKFIPHTDYGYPEDNEEMPENIFVSIGNPADRNKPGTVIISGYITDRDTKDIVAGTTVFVEENTAGTFSNDYGFYSLTLPRGVHLLHFSFIGMSEKLVKLNLNGPGELDIEMHSVLIPLKEAIVSARKNIALKRFEVGVEKINITTFNLLPTSMGESDILKSILLLPGVQSVGEGSAGFNVRGGSADQNLILLYGTPVHNSSHFFGFFSAVNSDIIKDVTLYKGGIPSRYGGRISSVLDIGMKEGNRQEFAGHAGISPITTSIMIEGPLKKDTCTFILAGRTTYSNWIFNLIENPALKNSRASFYDLNGNITYSINRNNKLDISSYYSKDAFRFNSDTTYSYNNNIVALKWRHFFTNRFFTSISVNNSYYHYDISSQDVTTEAFILSHKINSTGFKADFNWFQGRTEVNFGADLNKYVIMPGSYFPVGDSSLVIPQNIERERAWEGALYIDDKFILTDYMSINVGMRFSSFLSVGPQSVLLFDPEHPRGRSTVTDTLNFTQGEISSKYAGPELRTSLNFRITDKSSLKFNYNRTRQYLHLLTNSTSISPSDTWKLSDYYLKPQIGDQYAIGFYRMLFNNVLETSGELYYKNIRNMVDFKGGTKLVMNESIEKDLLNVKGKAYGLEIMVKKTEGRLRFSVGYTYARTFIKSLGTFNDEMINSGDWFPANFDKPNDLTITFNYLFSRRFSFSSNYTLSTGRPITYPITIYRIADINLIHYSDRNSYRIPDYSRLDISFKLSGNLKSNKIAHPYWTFSVYNLLARQNVYSIYFKYVHTKFDKEYLRGNKLSVFGKAIPSVTFSFDF